jgi:hypothetical protein
MSKQYINSTKNYTDKIWYNQKTATALEVFVQTDPQDLTYKEAFDRMCVEISDHFEIYKKEGMATQILPYLMKFVPCKRITYVDIFSRAVEGIEMQFSDKDYLPKEITQISDGTATAFWVAYRSSDYTEKGEQEGLEYWERRYQFVSGLVYGISTGKVIGIDWAKMIEIRAKFGSQRRGDKLHCGQAKILTAHYPFLYNIPKRFPKKFVKTKTGKVVQTQPLLFIGIGTSSEDDAARPCMSGQTYYQLVRFLDLHGYKIIMLLYDTNQEASDHTIGMGSRVIVKNAFWDWEPTKKSKVYRHRKFGIPDMVFDDCWVPEFERPQTMLPEGSDFRRLEEHLLHVLPMGESKFIYYSLPGSDELFFQGGLLGHKGVKWIKPLNAKPYGGGTIIKKPRPAESQYAGQSQYEFEIKGTSTTYGRYHREMLMSAFKNTICGGYVTIDDSPFKFGVLSYDPRMNCNAMFPDAIIRRKFNGEYNPLRYGNAEVFEQAYTWGHEDSVYFNLLPKKDRKEGFVGGQCPCLGCARKNELSINFVSLTGADVLNSVEGLHYGVLGKACYPVPGVRKNKITSMLFSAARQNHDIMKTIANIHQTTRASRLLIMTRLHWLLCRKQLFVRDVEVDLAKHMPAKVKHTEMNGISYYKHYSYDKSIYYSDLTAKVHDAETVGVLHKYKITILTLTEGGDYNGKGYDLASINTLLSHISREREHYGVVRPLGLVRPGGGGGSVGINCDGHYIILNKYNKDTVVLVQGYSPVKYVKGYSLWMQDPGYVWTCSQYRFVNQLGELYPYKKAKHTRVDAPEPLSLQLGIDIDAYEEEPDLPPVRQELKVWYPVGYNPLVEDNG